MLALADPEKQLTFEFEGNPLELDRKLLVADPILRHCQPHQKLYQSYLGKKW